MLKLSKNIISTQFGKIRFSIKFVPLENVIGSFCDLENTNSFEGLFQTFCLSPRQPASASQTQRYKLEKNSEEKEEKKIR